MTETPKTLGECQYHSFLYDEAALWGHLFVRQSCEKKLRFHVDSKKIPENPIRSKHLDLFVGFDVSLFFKDHVYTLFLKTLPQPRVDQRALNVTSQTLGPWHYQACARRRTIEPTHSRHLLLLSRRTLTVRDRKRASMLLSHLPLGRI